MTGKVKFEFPHDEPVQELDKKRPLGKQDSASSGKVKLTPRAGQGIVWPWSLFQNG